MRRTTYATALGVPALCVLLAAAAPQANATAEELIRQANAAFLQGDSDAAERLYAAAEERTTDPGLVAFNRGAVLFQLGDFRGAEVHYLWVLKDAACPPGRAARAWYNRGTCLVRRGGSTAVYREAIACLEQCLESMASDEPLKADARHNLELAKILWNEARKANAKPDSPNENPPSEDPESNPPPKTANADQQPGASDAGDGNKAGSRLQPVDPRNALPPAGTKPNPAAAQNAGNAPNLQPLQDSSTLQPLSPEDTREYLKRTAERLKKDRQTLRNSLYGPERPGLLDW